MDPIIVELFPFEFDVGDKVFAYYKGLLYEANVTKRRISDYGEIDYFVHYKGFKHYWDEWVSSLDVLPITEMNIGHKERLECDRKPNRKPRKARKNQIKSSPKQGNKNPESPAKNTKQSVEVDSQVVSKPKQIKVFQEPPKTDNTLSLEPANVKRGPSIATSVEPAKAQLPDKASIELKECSIILIDMSTYENPYTPRLKKLLAAQSSEPVVRPETIQLCQEHLETDDASSSNRKKRNRDASSLKPAKKKRATSQSTKPCTAQFSETSVQTFAAGAVRSKRLKMSQKPLTTEYAFSSNPAKRNRELAVEESAISVVEESAIPVVGESAIPVVGESAFPILEESAYPVVEESAIPDVEKSAESAIQSFSKQATAQQFAGSQSVEESAIPVGEESIPVEENEEDVRAVENIVIDIIPHSRDLAIKLLKEIELPSILKKAMEFDFTMHNTFQKVLKFPNDNCVANIIYTFTNSSYFIDDDEKKSSTKFCLTLLQCFNHFVHKCLTYLVEKKFNLQQKSLEYFWKRTENRPNINYVFKSQINPKTVWCYLYGPMYLVRLIDALPNILLSNLWFPNYNLEIFVHQIKELSRFLADKFDTYFTDNDYIDSKDSE